MRSITVDQPLEYRGFTIHQNSEWDRRPAPTDIYSGGKRKYIWQSKDYDGGTNDWGDQDTIEECVDQIDGFLEQGHVTYPDGDAWSGGFAENH